MGWVERSGDLCFLRSPFSPSNYLQTPQPNKTLLWSNQNQSLTNTASNRRQTPKKLQFLAMSKVATRKMIKIYSEKIRRHVSVASTIPKFSSNHSLAIRNKP
jgi:hypothetical protein